MVLVCTFPVCNFAWEKDFNIMVDKRQGYLPSHTMRELIRDNALLLPAISRFNIAFGFGDRTVRQICADNCVDTGTFLSVCNLLSGYACDSLKVSLDSLMGYLKRAFLFSRCDVSQYPASSDRGHKQLGNRRGGASADEVFRQLCGRGPQPHGS